MTMRLHGFWLLLLLLNANAMLTKLFCIEQINMNQEHNCHPQGRWGNGAAADSPLREARIKALILKEQVTTLEKLQRIPVPEKNHQQVMKRSFMAFDISLNDRMSCCLSINDKAPSHPSRTPSLFTNHQGARAA
jgi:hypothetical protein